MCIRDSYETLYNLFHSKPGLGGLSSCFLCVSDPLCYSFTLRFNLTLSVHLIKLHKNMISIWKILPPSPKFCKVCCSINKNISSSSIYHHQMTWCVGQITWCVVQMTWCVGQMTWGVGQMTWGVGQMTWCVGEITWYVGQMTWCVGHMTWCNGQMTWGVGQMTLSVIKMT